MDIEYRLFTTVGKKYEIDVIPFTSVNRTNTGYEFNIHSGKCNFYDDDREFLLNTINEYIFDICSYNATEKRQMELTDIYNSNVAKSNFLTNK